MVGKKEIAEGIKKVKAIMKESDSTSLVLERKYLFEVFDHEIVKIGETDKFPILNLHALFQFFIHGILVENYGPLIKFMRGKSE